MAAGCCCHPSKAGIERCWSCWTTKKPCCPIFHSCAPCLGQICRWPITRISCWASAIVHLGTVFFYFFLRCEDPIIVAGSSTDETSALTLSPAMALWLGQLGSERWKISKWKWTWSQVMVMRKQGQLREGTAEWGAIIHKCNPWNSSIILTNDQRYLSQNFINLIDRNQQRRGICKEAFRACEQVCKNTLGAKWKMVFCVNVKWEIRTIILVFPVFFLFSATFLGSLKYVGWDMILVFRKQPSGGRALQ